MIVRSFSARPVNDNGASTSLTELTLMAFGPSLIVALVVTALWLARVW